MFPLKPRIRQWNSTSLGGKVRSSVAFQSTEMRKDLAKVVVKQTFTSLQADALAKTSDDRTRLVLETPQR
jgi:hypothetical protein